MSQQHNDWKEKVQQVLEVCHLEIKRTKDIGKKMILASKTNTSLRESYERLGQIVCQEVEQGNLKVDHPEIDEIIATIKSCENDLEVMEQDVHVIKKMRSFSRKKSDD